MAIMDGMNAARRYRPRFQTLTQGLPLENAVRIEVEEGFPVLRASDQVQARIEELLAKQREAPLSPDEEQELDRFEEVDDYLSLLNRLARNRAA